MSGTRLASPKAPATEPGAEALLIVAHGDSGGACANRLANALAAKLRRTGRFCSVDVGYLRAGRPFEQVAAGIAADCLRVLPLLMSDGYYARQAIPQRLGLGEQERRRIIVEPPLGLHPRLPDLVVDESARTLTAAGFDPAGARLLLVAHGSEKSPASADATRWLRKEVAAQRRFAAVEMAFLEEAPLLPDQLARLEPPMCVFGLFIGEGMHGGEDLPLAIRRCQRPGVVLAPALPDCGGLLDMVAAGLQ